MNVNMLNTILAFWIIFIFVEPNFLFIWGYLFNCGKMRTKRHDSEDHGKKYKDKHD